MARAKKPTAAASSTKAISAEAFHSTLRSFVQSRTEQTVEKKQRLDLVTGLAAAGIQSLIVLTGGEQLRIRRLMGWIREQLFGNSRDSIVTAFGSELTTTASVDRLAAMLQSQSLFAAEQLVIINGFDELKAAQLKRLTPALLRRSPSCLLILTVEESDKLDAELRKAATVVRFTELEGGQLERWIAKEVQRAGGTTGIEPNAIRLLANCHGGNVTTLSQEIAKLALLVDDKSVITAELVASLLTTHPDRTTFELLTQMARRRVREAVRLSDELLSQGQHPLQLANFLSRCFRVMLVNKTGGGKGAGSELTNPWMVRNVQTAMHAFTEPELRQVLELMKLLDLQLKSSGISAPLAFSLFVQRVTLRAFAPLGTRRRENGSLLDAAS